MYMMMMMISLKNVLCSIFSNETLEKKKKKKKKGIGLTLDARCRARAIHNPTLCTAAVSGSG